MKVHAGLNVSLQGATGLQFYFDSSHSLLVHLISALQS